MRSDLEQALTEGRGVTAKIRWLTKVDEDGESEGRSRWIHATPLYGHNGSVGVWMILLVDEDSTGAGETKRRFRTAPPVANMIGGKEYDPLAARERRDREKTSIERLLPQSSDAHYTTAATSRVRPQGYVSGLDRRGPSSVASGRGGGAPSELSFQLR